MSTALLIRRTKKKRILELELARNLLNHNQVKNDFLHKLESAGADSPSEERGVYIQAIWANLRGEDAGVEFLEAKVETVRIGLDNWVSLHEDLRDFFDNIPGKYGFRLSDKGLQVKRNFFSGENSWATIIDNFVREFDEIAHKPEDERLIRLATFFAAADEIYKALSNMALKKDKSILFNGHFEII